VSVRYDTCSGIGNEELYAEKFLSIVPNLASSEIIVSNPRPDLKTQWTLFNLFGQVTSLTPIDAHGGKLVFNVTCVSPGLYFMKAETDEIIFIGKFIKE
jgi:hypothetical protein